MARKRAVSYPKLIMGGLAPKLPGRSAGYETDGNVCDSVIAVGGAAACRDSARGISGARCGQ